MGGFALHDADQSFLRVLDELTLDELYTNGDIEWPTITEMEIQDRSKTDIFSKGIVLLQTAWFIVQCIGRFATGLAVTEVEVVTLAFAALNWITYWLWWHKPSDVRCSAPVYLKTLETSSNPKICEARRQRDTKKLARRTSESASPTNNAPKHFRGLIITIIRTIATHFKDMTVQSQLSDDDLSHVPTFYSPGDEPLARRRYLPAYQPSLLVTICVIVLFGAIHFISWPSVFPTAIEKWLWRVSTILIIGTPFLMYIHEQTFGDVLFDSGFSCGTIIQTLMALILLATYIISRMILLSLPLILLRSLPPTSLSELKWSEFFPHI